jgi:hypothetical protein
VSDQNPGQDIQTALNNFKQKLPKPSRELTLELLRQCGFSYRDSTVRVEIYKSPKLPGHPVIINKGTHLHEGTARALINLIEKFLADMPGSGGK